MNFWKGEECEYCGKQIVEKKVTLHRKIKGKYIFIENVPAGICSNCGTRYYSGSVLKTIEQKIKGSPKAKQKVLVPVYSYATLSKV